MTFDEIKTVIKHIRTLNSEQTAGWLYGLIKTLPPHLNQFACEVGTYYGYMSTMMALAGMRTLCIDHMRCGFCDIQPDAQCLYTDVIQTFINSGVWSSIVPLPMKSVDALELLRVMKPSIGLLYLDGDHSYPTVLKELQGFDEFIPVGGYVCGDDCTLKDNVHVYHDELTFNRCWDGGLSDQFTYGHPNPDWQGAGPSGAVWTFFRDNPRYMTLPDVPPNQFGFQKVK